MNLLYLTHPDITGWTKKDITDRIKEINPSYQFNLIANPVINNMLVAWIPVNIAVTSGGAGDTIFAVKVMQT